MAESPVQSVGLGGDGDERAAIDEIERAFGVALDRTDAPGWITAGDLFNSLEKELTAQELRSPYVWKRFVVALCGRTGADPNQIRPESPLLSPSRLWLRVANWLASISLLITLCLLAMIAWALL